jgi:hypothetical protein
MTDVSEPKRKRLTVCVPLSPEENAVIESLRKTREGRLSRAEVMRQALYEMSEDRKQQGK